jgi:hypothetical protein
MLLLCLAPTDPPKEGVLRPYPYGERALQPAVLAITAGVVTGLVATVLFVTVRQVYSSGLFLGAPFVMGTTTAFLFNRNYDASSKETVVVTLMTFVVSGLTALLFAIEGLFCILMAFPIAAGAGLMGAFFGRTISRHGRTDLPPALIGLVVLSLNAAATPEPHGATVFEVRSSVDVAAAPDRVWRHVIAFDPIPEPADLLFRAGIAYPRSAVITGEGIGAIRHCIFSTGAFVEPITAWEPEKRLAFDVVSQPPALRELTLYRNVSPPHLDGYLRARRGEFRLVSMADGRTRLEGSTWYELDIAPAAYWQLFSDYLIQRIHRRVLEHIKREVEGLAIDAS